METTLITPAPTTLVMGSMRGRPVASPWLAACRPSMPSIRGTENPAMSASNSPTVKPRPARPAARLTVTDDLPTPPLPDETARTRVRPGISVAGGFSWARRRARAMTCFFWSGDISLVRTWTNVTPGRLPTRAVTSFCSWVRNGHPAVVKATRTVTLPSASMSHPRYIPRSTRSAPSSGSMTPRIAACTDSSLTRVATASVYGRG